MDLFLGGSVQCIYPSHNLKYPTICALLQNMSPMNSNAALMTRSLQMRNSLLTAATAAGAAGQPASGGQPSPSTASALLASQAAAAAMFNHQQASAASLFAAANIKSNSAASGVAGVHQISILQANGPAAASQGQRRSNKQGQGEEISGNHAEAFPPSSAFNLNH